MTDTNGNTSTDNVSFTVASGLFDITGDWSMDPVAGAFKVGPAPGSGEWWQNSDGDVAARACHFDDVYTFNADGSFVIDMGDATWLEVFQGVDADQCGAPVDPFVSGTFSYTYVAGSLTLTGRGAAVGLAKVNNEGEISQGAPIADAITYNITSQTDDGTNKRMTLQIEAADGVWWEFLLISGPGAGSGGGGGMSPIEGLTQNQNEALNGVFWSKCPKTRFVGRKRVVLAVCEAINQFNSGAGNKVQILETIGLPISAQAMFGFQKEDELRVKAAARKVSVKSRGMRRKLRAKRKSKGETKTTYFKGGFGL